MERRIKYEPFMNYTSNFGEILVGIHPGVGRKPSDIKIILISSPLSGMISQLYKKPAAIEK